ncbi:unknown [Clostridium sp. CAG:632]|nr:unknown [Clostridium sp. CAG:632]
MVTFFNIFGSSSYLSFRSDLKPIAACLFSRSFMMSSKSGNAPPQMNRMFFVLTVVIGTMAFLLPAPTGTSTSAPSNSFNNPCCTDSPLTSRLFVFRFLAILSISSINTIPRSAFSTSLSAAARSFDRTLSTSSPIYPASVNVVASVIASGTFNNLAIVLTR